MCKAKSERLRETSFARHQLLERMEMTLTTVRWKQLHPIKGCQAFLQWHRELIRETPPILFSHLVLKAMKDLKQNISTTFQELLFHLSLQLVPF